MFSGVVNGNAIPDSSRNANPTWDNDPDILRGVEASVRAKKEEERPMYEVVNGLIANFPKDYKQLRGILKGLNYRNDFMKALLEGLNYRNDFMKALLEGLKENVFAALDRHQGDYSFKASRDINDNLFNYLAAIQEIKDNSDEFGKNYFANYGDGVYDSYMPDLELATISDEMYKRRRNDAEVSIQIPREFSETDPQKSADSVTIIDAIETGLKGENTYGYDKWAAMGFEMKSVKEFDQMKQSEIKKELQKKAIEQQLSEVSQVEEVSTKVGLGV